MQSAEDWDGSNVADHLNNALQGWWGLCVPKT